MVTNKKAVPKKTRKAVVNKRKEDDEKQNSVVKNIQETSDLEDNESKMELKDEPILGNEKEEEEIDAEKEDEGTEQQGNQEEENEYDDEEGNEDDLEDDVEIDDEDKDMEEEEKEEEEEFEEKEDEEGGEDEAGDDMKCLYKYAARADSEEEDFEEEVFDDDLQQFTDVVPPEERITKAILYPKERTRLISDRTAQLILGAKPLVKNSKHLPAKEIAELELNNNIIPLIIERPLPNGRKERWHVKELLH